MKRKFKKRKEEKRKYNTLFYQFAGEKSRREFKKKDGTWYEVRKDGTLKSRPPVATILGALNAGPSHPAIYLPSAAQKRKDASLNILDELKKASKAIKGQAQASTLTASDKKGKETKTVEKLPKKRPDRKLKKLETKDVKTFETKEAKPIEKKKDSAPSTPNLKPFQGSYNQDTQKLVNIEGKTFVAPKSYEKPKSKTNPSFKRLLDKLGLNKGSYVGKPKTGHTDYRKSGLFK